MLLLLNNKFAVARRLSSPMVSVNDEERGDSGRMESVRALQQKQRQEVLLATQNFLNPAKKPLVKSSNSGSGSSSGSTGSSFRSKKM